MMHGEAHRIAVFGKTDRTVRCGRVWSNPDLYRAACNPIRPVGGKPTYGKT